MDAQDLQASAAVIPACSAGPARSTRHIRLDGDAVSHFKTALVRADLDDLAGQLVPQHARIGKERLASPKRVQVRATYPDPPDAHQRLLSVALRHGDRPHRKTTWLLQHRLQHAFLL